MISMGLRHLGSRVAVPGLGASRYDRASNLPGGCIEAKEECSSSLTRPGHSGDSLYLCPLSKNLFGVSL